MHQIGQVGGYPSHLNPACATPQPHIVCACVGRRRVLHMDGGATPVWPNEP